MKDDETGISIRFIQEWTSDDSDLSLSVTVPDKALMLAMHDDREDLTFAEKLGDALRFLKEQQP